MMHLCCSERPGFMAINGLRIHFIKSSYGSLNTRSRDGSLGRCLHFFQKWIDFHAPPGASVSPSPSKLLLKTLFYPDHPIQSCILCVCPALRKH